MTTFLEEIPQVHAGDEAVLLEMTPAQAEQLARILAHYDALPKPDHLRGYVAEVWHHTLVQLLAKKALVVGRRPEPVLVPRFSNVDLVDQLAAQAEGHHQPVYFPPDRWAEATAAAAVDGGGLT